MFHIAGGIFLGFVMWQGWCKFWDARAAKKQRRLIQHHMPQWRMADGRYVLDSEGNPIPRLVKPKREPLNSWSVATAVVIIGGLGASILIGN